MSKSTLSIRDLNRNNADYFSVRKFDSPANEEFSLKNQKSSRSISIKKTLISLDSSSQRSEERDTCVDFRRMFEPLENKRFITFENDKLEVGRITESLRKELHIHDPKEDEEREDENEEEKDYDDDENFIGILEADLDNPSVVRYSLKSPPKDTIEDEHKKDHGLINEDYKFFTPTITGDNGELKLELLNAHISLILTDTFFRSASARSRFLDVIDGEVSLINEDGKYNCNIGETENKIKDMVNVIVHVDQLIQIMDRFMNSSYFLRDCKQASEKDKAICQNQIVQILNDLVTEYVSTDIESSLLQMFLQSLVSLNGMMQLTNYRKQLGGNEPYLEPLSSLKYVPPSLLKSMSFKIIIPKPSVKEPDTHFSTQDIKIQEMFTMIYVTLLLEMKKLFEQATYTSLAAELELPAQLILDCIEGFLTNTIETKNAEVVVGLDKLLKCWVGTDENLRRVVRDWANMMISRWDSLDVEKGDVDDLEIENKFDVGKLFISEILDICEAGNDFTTTVKVANSPKDGSVGSNRGLGWLTIFQNDAGNRLTGKETREFEATLGEGSTSDIPFLTIGGTQRTLATFETKHTEVRHYHVRDWFRAFDSRLLPTKDKFWERCHRVKCKFLRVTNKLSLHRRHRRMRRGMEKLKQLYSQDAETHQSSHSREGKYCSKLDSIIIQRKNLERKKKKTEVDEQRNDDSKDNCVCDGGEEEGEEEEEEVVVEKEDCNQFAKLDEIYEKTTFSDLREKLSRYEELKKRRDRFMFLFFGEED